MCGLVGIRRIDNRPISREDLTAMRDRIRHRGPNDAGLYMGTGIGLGHVRLSVLDLSPQAAQPMRSRCRRFTIAYNGEVYNFAALREELARLDVSITSTGDTEPLLEYIAEFGVDRTVSKLEGFFAFALWDEKEQTLTLARDRHGIKPLYYTTTGDEIRFASETKALLAADSEPDACAFNAMLFGHGCTWGSRTLYKNIHAVRPGEMIRFAASTVPRTQHFFSLNDFVEPDLHEQLQTESDEALVDRVEEALTDSIRMRMISDAPLACLASGGVDSSLIASMAMKQDADLRLYHADVEHDSEREHAQALADHLGAELRTASVSDHDFIENLAEVTYYNDIPIVYHPNSSPFYSVSKLASSDGVKVLLTGEGSDEYFLGYPLAVLEPYLEIYRRTLEGLQNSAHRCFPRISQLLLPRRSNSRTEVIRRLMLQFDDELVKEESLAALTHIRPPRKRAEQARSLNLAQPHLSTLLHRNDRLAMAWGIESRFPFLGHALARLAVNLPARMKLRRTMSFHNPRHPFVIDKWCIRQVAKRYLPDHLARRPKKGFPISVRQRLSVDRSFFHDSFIANYCGLSRRAVDHMIDTTPPDWTAQLMFVEVWARLFLLRHTRDEVTGSVRKCVSIRGASPRSTAAQTTPGKRDEELALT